MPTQETGSQLETWRKKNIGAASPPPERESEDIVWQTA